jgi:hypothetical protein
MFEFSADDKFWVHSRQKWAYPVINPEACFDELFSHLIGRKVKLNGQEVKVVAVDRFAHLPPFLKGESISLLVEPDIDPAPDL